ncbi:hypothetical protein DENSPDRAFT_279178 [Dentipellis sp. KUC8613]|nr:hypothetical protein DENSPDRAFT_279178 [Dentipellis sp. KUC8613]
MERGGGRGLTCSERFVEMLRHRTTTLLLPFCTVRTVLELGLAAFLSIFIIHSRTRIFESLLLVFVRSWQSQVYHGKNISPEAPRFHSELSLSFAFHQILTPSTGRGSCHRSMGAMSLHVSLWSLSGRRRDY